MHFNRDCIARGSKNCLIFAAVCLLLSGLSMLAEADATSSKSESVSNISVPADLERRREMYRHMVSGGVPADLSHFTAVALLGLDDKDSEVRMFAARGLHVIDPSREKEVVAALGRRLQDQSEDYLVKHESLSALSSLKSSEAAAFWDDLVAAFLIGGNCQDEKLLKQLDVSYRDAAASVLLSIGGTDKAIPVFEEAKDAVSKRGALGALMVYGMRKGGQLTPDEKGMALVRTFVLEQLQDESVEVRRDAMPLLNLLLRDRKRAKTSADLEGNLMIKEVLEKQAKNETDKLLKEGIEVLLSYYEKEARPGMGTIPLPSEPTP